MRHRAAPPAALLVRRSSRAGPGPGTTRGTETALFKQPAEFIEILLRGVLFDGREDLFVHPRRELLPQEAQEPGIGNQHQFRKCMVLHGVLGLCHDVSRKSAQHLIVMAVAVVVVAVRRTSAR